MCIRDRNITALGIGGLVRAGARRSQACSARDARGRSAPACLGSPEVTWEIAAIVCEPMFAAAPIQVSRREAFRQDGIQLGLGAPVQAAARTVARETVEEVAVESLRVGSRRQLLQQGHHRGAGPTTRGSRGSCARCLVRAEGGRALRRGAPITVEAARGLGAP
eukprot:7432664-Pyramimonas_sp.AAC.1